MEIEMPAFNSQLILLPLSLLGASFICFFIASLTWFLVSVWFILVGITTGVYAIMTAYAVFQEWKNDL
jgi:hypothetical protein